MAEKMGKYLELLERTLNELKISYTSDIRKRFIFLVKDKFIKNDDDNFIEEDDSNDKMAIIINKEDIRLFDRYKLLKTIHGKMKLTMKGVALALGMEVDTKEGDEKYNINVIKKLAYGSNGNTKKERFNSWLEKTLAELRAGEQNLTKEKGHILKQKVDSRI